MACLRLVRTSVTGIEFAEQGGLGQGHWQDVRPREVINLDCAGPHLSCWGLRHCMCGSQIFNVDPLENMMKISGLLTLQNAHNCKVASFKGSEAHSCSWSQAVKSPWKFQAGMPSSTSWCVWLQCHLCATSDFSGSPGGQFCANTDGSTLTVTCSVTSTQALFRAGLT